MAALTIVMSTAISRSIVGATVSRWSTRRSGTGFGSRLTLR
jgi:hypothetical protein